MRRAIIVPGLLAVVLATGQYLEKTIWLPDSFRAVITPSNVLYNSGSNTVYVGDHSSGGGIVVLDGITMRKSTEVFLPDEPTFMVYAPEVNKVYCADEYVSNVYVIDGAGHRLLPEIPVPGDVRDLCYDPVTRRVYCACRRSSSVAAIDANADTVVAEVSMPTGAQRLCCNWRYNKVYCADEDSGFVYVIDGAGDSMLTWLYVSEVPGQMLYNPLSNRVYCPDEAYYDVGIIDAEADTLIQWITMGAEDMGLCLNTSDNELYVTDGYDDRVFVICGAGDTLKSQVAVGGHPRSPVYDSVTNRVYVVCQDSDSLVAIDAAGDTVLDRVRVGDSPAGLCIDTRQRRAFVADPGSRDVVVLGIPADTVVNWLDFPLRPQNVCIAGDDDHVYCSAREASKLMVVEPGAAGRVFPVVLNGGVCAIASAPELDKLYICCYGPLGRGDKVSVLDCSADTLVAEVSLQTPANVLVYRPHAEHPKVYAAGLGYDSVTVLDAVVDSVTGKFGLRRVTRSAVYASGSDRLLTTDQYGWLKAIDCSNDSLADSLFVRVYPQRLAYVPGYDYAVVVLPRDTLAIVDVSSMSEVARIDVGIMPDIVEYCSALGKLYCFEDTTAIAISVESLLVVGSMTLPGAVDDAAFDSTAGRLLCADSRTGSMTLIDCVADTVLGTVSMGQGPCSVVWSERWQRFFVADEPQSALLVVVDSMPVGLVDRSVAERSRPGGRIPTIVRGVLVWSATTPALRNVRDIALHSRAELLDITGRRVMDLKPGENDIRHISPGVYFVREEGPRGQGSEGSARELAGCASSVRKVVIQR